MAFTPPASQVSGKQFNGRDVFLGAAGGYVVYNALNSSVDCDYDDIMEGDDDCKEVTLTDDQVKSLGITDDKDTTNVTNNASSNKKLSTAAFFFIVVALGLSFIILVLYLAERHRNKRKRSW
ncbi:hypothetical protein LAV82_22780 [Bacillus sp. ILBB4]|nr:hypothetical protein [Bacillus sp. ILBB4]